MYRAVFCAFLLLYTGVLSHLIPWDTPWRYGGVFFLIYGTFLFLIDRKLNLAVFRAVTLLFIPMFISAFMGGSLSDLYLVLKTYLATLYFTNYLKMVGFSMAEYLCVASTLFVSFWYYISPRPYNPEMEQRWTGYVEDPNFTALSLIQGLCALICAYQLTNDRRMKQMFVVLGVVCCLLIFATASRAGLIALFITAIILGLRKNVRIAAGITALMGLIIIGMTGIDITGHLPSVFSRFYFMKSGADSMVMNTSGRNLLWDHAWNEIDTGGMFTCKGIQGILDFMSRYGLVPHNSLLDVGIMYGKFCFYFYSLLLAVMLISHAVYWFRATRVPTAGDPEVARMSLMFIPAMSMYLSLTVTMSLPLILCVSYGSYVWMRGKHRG